MDIRIKNRPDTRVSKKVKLLSILFVIGVWLIFTNENLMELLGVRDEYEYESYLDSDCQVPRFDSEEDGVPDIVSCQRPPPIKGSCEIAKEVFFSEPTPTCSDENTYEICRIQSKNDGHQVDCSNTFCKHPISFGAINTSDGSLLWKQMSDGLMLERSITELLSKNESNGNYGFCFLNCTLKNNTIAKQLLLVPQHITRKSFVDEKFHENDININVIWLDSTSHSHFYRSMPKTVETLRTIKKNKSMHVFNYDLMQSMKGGTWVNTVALTAGKIRSHAEVVSKGMGVGNLFRLFKHSGYHVTMVDDICWNWSLQNCPCGMPAFMGLKSQSVISEFIGKVFGVKYTAQPQVNMWGNYSKALNNKGISEIGIAMANCEIINLKNNGITDPFYTPNSNPAICYNGKYQTDYTLSFLEMLQSQLNSVQRPHFNYLHLYLGHEATGRRIQTLDGSFAKFMTYLSRQRNTFTVMFGDHGNRYGTFVQKTKEANIEMAHTVMFVLASRDLEAKLGKEKIDILKDNQNRLVNLLDIRHTLLSLAPLKPIEEESQKEDTYDVHPNGLFHPISRKRSCESMGISPEAGKCICSQGRVIQKVSNTSSVVVLANFVMGEINNMIQSQLFAASGETTSGFGSCQHLMATWITNVQQTVSQNFTITEMDIYVPAGSIAPQNEDVFGVVVQVRTNMPSLSSIKLVDYKRTSAYAPYKQCGDTGVDADLCVCSSSGDGGPKKTDTWNLRPPVVLGYETKVITVNKDLYMYERETPNGLILETSCESLNTAYNILISIEHQNNVVFSKAYPLQLTVRPRNMMFVDSFYQRDFKVRWKLKYLVNFEELV